MIEYLEAHEEPDSRPSSEYEDLDKISASVAKQFAEGKTFVHLKDLSSLHNKPKDEIEEYDNDGCYVRYQNMLRVCQNLAVFDGMDPLRSLESVGHRGEIKIIENEDSLNPRIKREEWVELHTEDASQTDPPRIVSYWNAEHKAGPGETIHILSVDHLRRWAMDPDNRVIFQEMKDSQIFRKEGFVFAPIYSPFERDELGELTALDTLRYDGGAIDYELRGKDLPFSVRNPPSKKVENFFEQAAKLSLAGQRVHLNPGDVLFIDNHRAAHALRFEENKGRLLYKLVLSALKADTVTTAIEKQQENLFTSSDPTSEA